MSNNAGNAGRDNFTYPKLRGRIVEKYKTNAIFAEAFGISKNAWSRKLQNKEGGFSQKDIIKCCKLLEIQKNEIPDYFF